MSVKCLTSSTYKHIHYYDAKTLQRTKSENNKKEQRKQTRKLSELQRCERGLQQLLQLLLLLLHNAKCGT